MVTPTCFYNGIELSAETWSIDIQVGRSRELDDFQAVSGSVTVGNYDRNFDPPFFATPTYLLMESGDFLLLETGDKIILEQGSQASGAYGVIAVGGTFVVKDGATTIFTGHVEDVTNQYGPDGTTSATITLGDVLTSLASTDFQTEWETTDNQLSGARLTELFGRADVDLAAKIGTFNTGTIHLQGYIDDNDPDTDPTGQQGVIAPGTNVLEYARTIVRTEHGKLWVGSDGDIEFRDRYTFPSSTPVATLGTGGIGFRSTGAGLGAELRAWQASVSRVGGEPKSATATTSPPANIGPRGITRHGLLFQGDDHSESLAEELANRFADPEAVIGPIEVVLSKQSTADRATIAGVQINDSIGLVWTPTNTGTEINQTLVVEGWHYTADNSGWASKTLQLAAYPNTNYFTLDTDSLDGGVPLGF